MLRFRRCALPFCLSLSALVLPPVDEARAELIRVYVTNSAGDSVHVIDPATNKVVQEFKGPEAMHGVAFSPDGARVYVSNEHERTLDVFDRAEGSLIKHVKLSDRPNNIAVARDGRIVVGIARGAAVHLFPEIELFVIYVLMVGVLLWRPQGLFGAIELRKI
jgi:hypothetical protein